jgi:hypothetical protein
VTRRRLAGLLGLGLALALLLAVPPMRAVACSCAMPDPLEASARAEAVFVGAVVDRRAPAPGAMVSSADPVEYLFAVEEVRKGPVVSTLVVSSPLSGASCGTEFAIGSRWLVYGSRAEGGALTTHLCEPNELLSDTADLPDEPVRWPDEVAESPDANGAIPQQLFVMAVVIAALAAGSAVAFLWKGRRPG